MKLYAFVWHAVANEVSESEGASGAHCDSAETEVGIRLVAEVTLIKWAQENISSCKIPGCEHTTFIEEKIRPRMIIKDGMVANANDMVKIPALSEREAVLRVITELISMETLELIDEVLGELTEEEKAFLNNPDFNKEPTEEEAQSLGSDDAFVKRAWQRVKERINVSNA